MDDRFGFYEKYMTPDPDNLSDLSHDQDEEEEIKDDEWIDVPDNTSDISAIDMDYTDSEDDAEASEIYESDSEELKTLNSDNFPHPDSSKLADGPNGEQQQAPGPSKSQWVRVYPPGMKQDITDRFTVKDVGPKHCPISNDPNDYFDLFFTKSTWTMMVQQTNVYAHSKKLELLSAGKLTDSRLAKWVDVTEREMQKFIAIVINLGIGQTSNLKEHWISILHMPFYSKTMSLERFHLILSMFHLSTSVNPAKGDLNFDPLIKIRDFINSMNETFKLYFVPGQVISVDESCFAKKKRKVQYTPVKHRVRYGIKKFELFDCASRYVLHVSLVSGKDFFKDHDTFNRKVVQELLTQAQCLGKGYHLMIQNYYKKIPLSCWLLTRDTFLTGIVDRKSKELCKTIVKARTKFGQLMYFKKNNVLLTKYKYNRRLKPVHFVTTACNVDDWDSAKNKNSIKPSDIPYFNKSKYYITSTRPTKRYWKKAFYSVLDTVLLNAYILFKSQSGKSMDRYDFARKITNKLVGGPQPIYESSSDDESSFYDESSSDIDID